MCAITAEPRGDLAVVVVVRWLMAFCCSRFVDGATREEGVRPREEEHVVRREVMLESWRLVCVLSLWGRCRGVAVRDTSALSAS